MLNQEIHPVRIKLIGTGCRIWAGKFDEAGWNDLHIAAEKIKMPLTSAVFFPAFYSRLENPALNSLADLGNYFKTAGLLLTNHSIIEIQVYRKRRRTIFLSEIVKPVTLFPVYNTVWRTVSLEPDRRMLFVVEKETGIFLKYRVFSPTFVLDNLFFELTDVKTKFGENFFMLNNLYYANQPLIPLSGNGLVCGQYALTVP
ncbi:hypothetical protein LA303_06560 [Candidatus Sulfidibacterium hydrothermale]|uniref:hypothetical protein n=1 Tax=Candidatus Sulfidibacterium hydrothermale TaxID=2875962 RepID=UPI001F0B5085|nr:hypothetical protein [Candidatus Sulfidibacterium hydrothermale]UBM61088.1 hypothetical protein LA303_06560 [Candidatus Sulfidibacterium hydrothermale]